jgi:hypothetical protein
LKRTPKPRLRLPSIVRCSPGEGASRQDRTVRLAEAPPHPVQSRFARSHHPLPASGARGARAICDWPPPYGGERTPPRPATVTSVTRSLKPASCRQAVALPTSIKHRIAARRLNPAGGCPDHRKDRTLAAGRAAFRFWTKEDPL